MSGPLSLPTATHAYHKSFSVGVHVRFYHEASYQSGKEYFLPEVDFIDIEPRRETVPSSVTSKKKDCMLQARMAGQAET